MAKTLKRGSLPANRFRQKIGSWGEDLAAAHLQKLGYAIIGRNVRTAYGEIDLIAQKDPSSVCPAGSEQTNRKLTVFVEVKTRRSLRYGYPEQAVTSHKKAHLISSAEDYIQQHPEMSGDWRVDVIAILKRKDDVDPEIVVFENAISL